jgi:predicted CXXCH cytochrome family protein
VLNSELFSASPHKSAFDAQKIPECESCHGNHAIMAANASLIGVTQGATCTRCHAEGSTGYGEAVVMRRLIDSLETSEERAKQLVGEAEQKGMEIGEAKFRLREIRQSRLESRTTVHAANEEKLRVVVGKGLGVAAWVTGEGERAIDDYYFRRVGLGVSTLIITFLAVMLYLYIRRLEKQQKESTTS